MCAENRNAGAPVLADPNLARKFNELMTGHFVTQLVYVAAKLAIPDLIGDASMSAEDIAAKTGANTRALAPILRALTALEVLAERNGRYSLTPIGAALRSFPGWRSQALLIGEEYFKASGELLHTVLTGTPAFDRAMGMSFYDYAQQNRDAASRFGEVMTLTAQIRYADLTAIYDFSRAARLVDVGSGHGGLTAIILRAAPAMRAVLMDLPPVIEGAKRYLGAQALSDRCEFVAGNFFESVPEGGDLYLLSQVIVNWDDDHAVAILKNCRRAIAEAARLVLVEFALIPGKQPTRAGAIAALAAYAIQGSITRSEAEYRAILDYAGFELDEIRPMATEPYAVICAHPRSQ